MLQMQWRQQLPLLPQQQLRSQAAERRDLTMSQAIEKAWVEFAATLAM